MNSPTLTTQQLVELLGRAWRFDVPDADKRRGRQIVLLVGSREHSGMTWVRAHAGVAATMYEGRQGYVPKDIARLENEGDMDPGTGVVVAWMDLDWPAYPANYRDLPPLPTPTRAAILKTDAQS